MDAAALWQPSPQVKISWTPRGCEVRTAAAASPPPPEPTSAARFWTTAPSALACRPYFVRAAPHSDATVFGPLRSPCTADRKRRLTSRDPIIEDGRCNRRRSDAQ